MRSRGECTDVLRLGDNALRPPVSLSFLMPPAHSLLNQFDITHLQFTPNRDGAVCQPRASPQPPFSSQTTRPRATSPGRSQDSTAVFRSQSGVTPQIPTLWHPDAISF